MRFRSFVRIVGWFAAGCAFGGCLRRGFARKDVSKLVILLVLLSYNLLVYKVRKTDIVACVQISALALMSSRPTLRPLFCEANVFSHNLSSCRRVLQSCSESRLSIVEKVVNVRGIRGGGWTDFEDRGKTRRNRNAPHVTQARATQTHHPRQLTISVPYAPT